MELSDDIAYAVHDLEDSIALKIITRDDYRVWYEENKPDKKYKGFEEDLFGKDHSKRKRAISLLVHRFIDSVEVYNKNTFDEQLLDLNAHVPDDIKKEIQDLKDFTYKIVIRKHEIKTLEFKGGRIVEQLFDAIDEHTDDLLPDKYLKLIKNNPSIPKQRFVCDFIAGMTDNYASSLFDRLFTTNTGSIFTKL